MHRDVDRNSEVNSMKSKVVLALAIAACGVSATAGDYGKWFEKMDANADGYLSADELGEGKAHKIDKLDTNGDRLISREEFDAYKASKHKKDDRA